MSLESWVLAEGGEVEVAGREVDAERVAEGAGACGDEVLAVEGEVGA